MRGDRRLAGLCVTAALLTAAGARAEGTGGDEIVVDTGVPPAASVGDPAIAACKLLGAVGSGESCGNDTSCSEPNHLINLLSYLATLTPRVAATTAACDRTKPPKDQSPNGFVCLDQGIRDKTTPRCNLAAALHSAYASVLTAQQRAAIASDIAAALQRAAIAHRCNSATTLCLDRDGKPLGAQKTLQRGDQLTVVVLSPSADDVGTAAISVAGVKVSDSLAKVAASSNKVSSSTDVTIYVVASAISDPIGDDVRAVRVTFKAERADLAVRSALDFPVERGRYYVDFGLALPFVILGNRVVTTPALAEQTTTPRAALSAIVFLAGRYKDEIRVNGRAAWGVQIATDFDFTKSVSEKDYYLGVAWEPIAGFGIGAGVALVRGQFIPAIAGPTDQAYIARPYIGVFLTPDFVSSARAAATALQPK